MLKVLLVDDEALARVEMRRLLSVHKGVTVVGEAASVAQALALTRSGHPDLVFLDIKLAGESGFDYVFKVTEPAPRIVFVTAHDRYALRGFECNALDYLLKPVRPERLADTLRRLQDRQPALPERTPDEDDVVFVKADAEARFVPWRDIQCIASCGNYTRLQLATGETLMVLRTLAKWIELVPPDMFLQVHRTALVRLKAIRKIVQTEDRSRAIHLEGGMVVPVGRKYLPTVQALLREPTSP